MRKNYSTGCRECWGRQIIEGEFELTNCFNVNMIPKSIDRDKITSRQTALIINSSEKGQRTDPAISALLPPRWLEKQVLWSYKTGLYCTGFRCRPTLNNPNSISSTLLKKLTPILLNGSIKVLNLMKTVGMLLYYLKPGANCISSRFLRAYLQRNKKIRPGLKKIR